MNQLGDRVVDESSTAVATVGALTNKFAGSDGLHTNI